MLYVYTPGLEQRDGLSGALHLFGMDALGTVRALVNDDAGQAVTDTFGAYAFGNPRNRTGSDAFTFAFGGADGYQTDPNGLLLLGNREYHPFTGRFLTRDPAGAGDNDYEYADDNPLREIDPSGLDGIPSFDVAKGTSNQAIIDQAVQEGAAPGTTLQVSDANGKFLYSVQVPGDSSISLFRLPQNPGDLTNLGWRQIDHGGPPPHRNAPGVGPTRWISPNGKDGLEHHPAKPGGKPGTHAGDDNYHSLKHRTDVQGNDSWDYTNPKDTLYPGDEYNPFSDYYLPDPQINLGVVAGVSGGGLLLLAFVLLPLGV